MKRFALAYLALAFASASPVLAQSAPPQSLPVSVVTGSVDLSVTAASSRVGLPSPQTPFNTVTIYNAGQKDAYVAVGDNTATATTASLRIPAGAVIPFWLQWTAATNYVAAITAGSDTTTLHIWQSNGPMNASANGATFLSGILSALTSILNASSTPVTQLASTPNAALLQNASTANGNGASLNVAGMVNAVFTTSCTGTCSGAVVTFKATEDGTNFSTTLGTASSLGAAANQSYAVPGYQAAEAVLSGCSGCVVTVTGHAVPVGGGNQAAPASTSSSFFASATPTVQNAAYASGNCMGGFQAVPVARNAGGSGTLNKFTLMSKGGGVTPLTVYVFAQNPASSTCTDKGTFTLSSTDLSKVMGVFTLTPAAPLGTSTSEAENSNLTDDFVTSGNSNVYVAIVSGGTWTPASASDLVFNMAGFQN